VTSWQRRAASSAAAALLVFGSAAALAQQPPAATASPPTTGPVRVASQLTAVDVDAWLDGYLPYALKVSDIAGACVAVVKDGQVLTERGYGFADVEKRTPVDPKLTLFRPGSVSKLITWTAVMQQVELGKIDLDADINQYLDFKVPGLGGKPITMRNLMQHTAGFEEQVKDIISEKPPAPSFVALLKAWVPERVFAPGTTPAYSNYGASLAGYIVQRVSGEPFDEYLERHIFAPLDMKYSTFRQPLPPALAPFMSQGYLLASEPPHGFEMIGPAPAGAMSSPAEDMAHFMIAHLQNGEYHGQRILKPETAAQMHDSPLTLLPPLNRMELGFFETNINGREVIAHLGDSEYFHTSLHLFLKENVGFYVSFNSLGRDGAAETLRWALFQDFADRYFPGGAAPAALDAQTAAAHAALMRGAWVSSRGSQSNFLAGIGLLLQVKVGSDEKHELIIPVFPGLNGKQTHWIEIAPFVWQQEGSHDRAAAQVVDGKPVRFSIDMLSPFMVFERPPWYASSTWLLPVLYVSGGALLLTVVLWPVSALIRRHYRATLALTPQALRAYRLSRIGALVILLGIALWGLVFTLVLKGLTNLGAAFNALLWFAESFGLVAFLGGLALMLWNLLTVWGGLRRWPARTWSVVLVLAAVTVVWVALVFKLFSFGTNY
jgi:CubicO group peptidase (beta-lactamase class C family)